MTTQKATLAIHRLINAWPQSGTQDQRDVFLTFEEALESQPDEAIEHCVKQYLAGTAPGQNPKYRPSVAEFAAAVRSTADWQKKASKPRAAQSVYTQGGPPPYELRRAHLEKEHAGEPVVFEALPLEAFMRSKQLAGCTWCAGLNGRVFGPKGMTQEEADRLRESFKFPASE